MTTNTENLGFAIPINSVKTIIESIINYGKVTGRPYLGISVKKFAEGEYKEGAEAGVYCMELTRGGPAEKAGIKVGVYFFTQALTPEEARDEADFTLSIIKDHNISYPVAFDTEYIDDEEARTNTTEISDELRSEICTAFCERIKEEGYYPMIYASENWFRRSLEVESLKQYDFWAPQYLEENDFLYDFTIWQYTDEGSIPGVSGPVDLDISMVDYASFVPHMRDAVVNDGSIETY